VPTGQAGPSADGLLLERIRAGDLDAGHQFVQDHYPGVYRYLLYLTGSVEAAEDLTQETFLQAWRRLDTYEGRAALRTWLHRIARREFLQALRSQRLAPGCVAQVGEQGVVSLEAVGEVREPRATGLAETIELRVLMEKLPAEERETLVLHYLEGYQHEEIAHILGIPLRRVRQRLAEARGRLQQELAEGDLPYLNEPSVPMRRWAWLPLDQMFVLATRLTRGGAADRKALMPGATTEETMERREFLRQAAVGAAGLMLSETEKEIVDPRLTQKVTCAFKGTALSDLCEKLKSDTGVHLAAGPSVADEKVTLFCEKTPLREVMRQLSRPFGYTWLRSGQAFRRSGVRAFGSDKNGPAFDLAVPERLNAQDHRFAAVPPERLNYRYELVQDLRSQLLEEELRNRDRHAAMVALDREIQQFRPYLDLSPDEALEKAKTAPPAEKDRLERLAGLGWGVAQLYFRLSPEQLNRLWAGEELEFRDDPGTDTARLPPDMAAGVLASLRHRRLLVSGDSVQWGYAASLPAGLPPAQIEGARPLVHLRIVQSELGQYALEGFSGLTLQHPECVLVTRDDARALGPLAAGVSPGTPQPSNDAANARWSRDPTLQRQVTLSDFGFRVPTGRSDFGLTATSKTPDRGTSLPDKSETQTPGGHTKSRISSADMLEALHHATGMPLVGDYYTRLFPAAAVPGGEQRVYDLLNECADTLRLRWRKDEGWLQFRSATYFQDRLKEVPNRLLNRWASARAARRRHSDTGGQQGSLTLDELVEIAGLPDVQLDANDMAEGAKVLWGLEEWDLARSPKLRPHWRFLATLAPAQREEATGASGLVFTRLTLAQQQQFLRLGLGTSAGSLGLQELAVAHLKIDYTVPGWFQWPAPGTPDPSFPGSVQHSVVREETRAAALAAARKLDPAVSDASVVPSSLDGMVIYTFGTPMTHYAVRVVSTRRNFFMSD
jgi:RNA polymerase sigma-70 factor (ECF subfamily)